MRNDRIDTLRGISIVLVLLHHFNIAYAMQDSLLATMFGWQSIHAVFRNGNYAVTMFFVVSGFLITSNEDRRWSGLANLRAITFYRRRAARILPCVLLLLVAVNLLATSGLTIFRDHPESGGAVPLWLVDLASLTFCINVLMSHAGWLNYVLCVQWSLAIEEVFYLSFPILCLTLRRERLLLGAWCALIVVGPIWRATHAASEYVELNAYLACFDGIAFGCAAALLAKRVRIPASAIRPARVGVASLMTVFYLSASIRVTAVYGVTLMAFGTAILLLLVARPATRAAEAPALAPILAPLRSGGRLSYELYLFHLLVLASLRIVSPPDTTPGADKTPLCILYLVLSFALAAVIARCYANPLNRLIRGEARRAALAA